MNKYYFTFCFNQKHSQQFVVIHAEDNEQARDKMFSMYGKEWGFCYDEERWHPDGISQENKYGLTMLAEYKEE